MAGGGPVRGRQGVFALAVQQPARAVQEVQRRSLRPQEEARQGQVAIGDPIRSADQPQLAQALPGGVVPLEEPDVVDEQLLNRKCLAVRHHLDQVDKEARAELEALGLATAEARPGPVIAAKVEDLGSRAHRLAGRQPNADPLGLYPAQYRSGEQGVHHRPFCASWDALHSEGHAPYPIVLPCGLGSRTRLQASVAWTPIVLD